MKSSSWLTGARTEVEQPDSRMMCMKNALNTKEYTLIWDLSEYQSAFHYGGVEGQGWEALLHSSTASRLQRMIVQIHDWLFSVSHMLKPRYYCDAPQHSCQKCTPEHRLSFTMIAECKRLQVLSVKHTQQLHSSDVFIQAFLISLFPSLHWNNRQWQWVKVLTLTFVLFLTISLFPSISFSSMPTSIHPMR